MKRGCETCKFEKRCVSEYPCSNCARAFIDQWKPKPKEGAVKDE